ncbi:MAG: NnrU family protein [Myxococcales bacterium]|nr:NnrU family protein [Myxococcales bacterium]
MEDPRAATDPPRALTALALLLTALAALPPPPTSAPPPTQPRARRPDPAPAARRTRPPRQPRRPGPPPTAADPAPPPPTSPATPPAPIAPLPNRPRRPTAAPAHAKTAALMTSSGCLACHTPRQPPRPQPPFARPLGRPHHHHQDGRDRPVAYDRAYLTRALLAPDAELATGHPPGVMPAYHLTEDQIDALAAALADAAATAPDPAPTTFAPLIAGLLLFVLGHFALSAAPLRARLVARLGEGPFSGLYSLVALAGLALMTWGHRVAPWVELWPKPTWTQTIPLHVMPIVMLLWVFGFTSKNPTAVAQGSHAAAPPQGITAITRHPALWGFVLWALAHLPPNGDLASLLFFGGFLLLAVGGMWHIDRRRARTLGDAWHHYAAQTSVIPFAALLTRRARLRFTRADLIRLIAAAVLYIGFLHAHPLLFGVPARIPAP